MDDVYDFQDKDADDVTLDQMLLKNITKLVQWNSVITNTVVNETQL